MLRDIYRLLEYQEAIDPNDCYREEILDGSLKARLTAMRSGNSRAVELMARIAEIVRTERAITSLACHQDPRVRAAVADNPCAPQRVMAALAFDDHPDVRYCVAENANSGVEVLNILCDDQNPYVQARAQKTLKRLRSSQSVPLRFTPSASTEPRKLQAV